MADKEFENIIKSFKEQAIPYLPKHYKSSEKNLVLKAVEYYSEKVVLFLSDKKNIDMQSKYYFVQIVGEWTFNKTVDYVDAKLPIKYYKEVMNSLFDAISSICYKKFEEKLQIKDILKPIELIVKETWEAEILKLEKLGVISNEESLIAQARENFINYYSKPKEKEEQSNNNLENSENVKTKDNGNNEIKKIDDKNNKKILKDTLLFIFILISLFFFVVLIIKVFCFIYNVYLNSENLAYLVYYLITLIGCLWLLSRLSIKEKVNKLFLLLEDTKKNLSDITNPNFLYTKIPNTHISIGLSVALSSIDNSNSNLKKRTLGPIVTGLRKKLAINFGYIFPQCSMFVDETLKNYEFAIYVKQNLVLKKEIKSTNISDEFNDIVISEFTTILFQYVNCILTREYVEILLKNCDYEKQVGIPYDFVFEIISNLLREKVSIKNAKNIFEKIFTYSHYYNTPDEISERIREDFAIKISNQYSAKDNSISAIVFDEKYENFLKQNVVNIENSKKMIMKNIDEQKLVSIISSCINNKSNKNIVFICDGDIRLPLYRLLSEYFPSIVILSNKEITEDKNLVIVETIKGEF